MVERRFYTWTAPFARGVDVMHQVTDLLGIAMAGPEGNRLMGFGFPDQTIIWDGSAIENTTNALIEEQSKPIPWRTVDIASGFDSSLASDQTLLVQGARRMAKRRNRNRACATGNTRSCSSSSGSSRMRISEGEWGSRGSNSP